LKMPVFGMGVYQSNPGKETFNAVSWALSLGYPLIDTAAMYQNEVSVGKAIKASGTPREEIFITTKVNGPDHGYRGAIRSVKNSLEDLDVDYLDLVLIHSPFGGKLVETYDGLLEMQRQGLVRSVGVSNFGLKHLEALQSHGRPRPAVNQIEMHPLIYQERKALVSYCKEANIAITAYGSIFFGRKKKLNQKIIKGIAQAHEKSPAQVLLRWGLQMKLAIIPKSTSSIERQRENMNLFDFELTEKEMEVLTTLQTKVGARGTVAYWNPVEEAPVDIGETTHWSPENKEL